MAGDLLTGLAVAGGLMTGVWILSLIRRDVSIIDIFWGAGFALVAWVYAALAAGGGDLRRGLVLGCVTVWGLRLSLHILARSRGRGEDARYAAMREYWGTRFWWVSLFTVFLLQAVLLWLIAMPLYVALRAPQPGGLTIVDGIGLVLFVTGFLFESIGDWQLTRFKNDPANEGRLLTTGLWRYTRHPNYFGDAVVWWGLTCFGLATGTFWVLISPALMTFLLMRVSGVTLLERAMKQRPGYEDYTRRTPAFFPWFPKSASGDPDRTS